MTKYKLKPEFDSAFNLVIGYSVNYKRSFDTLEKGTWAYNRIINLNLLDVWFDKMEPEYVPFEYSDVSEFLGKHVRSKDGSVTAMVIYAREKGITVYGSVTNTYDYMFEHYEFVDGKPFGKLK